MSTHVIVDRDDRLEALSDMVRRGEAVSFDDAIAVIEYQEGMHRNPVGTVKRWMDSARAAIAKARGEKT